MDLTVLICSRNCTTKIFPCLDALVAQQKTEGLLWELIISEYNSSDKELELIDSYWKYFLPHIPFSVLRIPEEGKTPALIAGFEGSSGAGICIVDDDNIVNEDYLCTAHELLTTNNEIGVIGAKGDLLLEDDVILPLWFPYFCKMYAVGEQSSRSGFIVDGDFFWGAGSVFRRDAYKKAIELGFIHHLNPTRGDDNALFLSGFSGGEDPEMCIAVVMTGYKLWYEPRLQYRHFIKKSRLTENFLLDTVKGQALAASYLRIFLSYAKAHPESKLITFTKKLFWRASSLHILYILISLLRSLIQFKLGGPHFKLHCKVLAVRAYYEVMGTVKISQNKKILRKRFQEMYARREFSR